MMTFMLWSWTINPRPEKSPIKPRKTNRSACVLRSGCEQVPMSRKPRNSVFRIGCLRRDKNELPRITRRFRRSRASLGVPVVVRKHHDAVRMAIHQGRPRDSEAETRRRQNRTSRRRVAECVAELMNQSTKGSRKNKLHFGASAGQADARRRDAGDVVISSRSGNAADARPPPRPRRAAAPTPSKLLRFTSYDSIGHGSRSKMPNYSCASPKVRFASPSLSYPSSSSPSSSGSSSSTSTAMAST